MGEKNDAVCLKIFSSRGEAEIVRSMLSSQGIKSFILGDDAGGMYPPIPAGIRLFVAKKDQKRAESIL